MKKTVLITGASRGIGRSLAERFAKEGYHLVLTCRNRIDLLQNMCESLSASYCIQCLPIQADMGVYEDVERVFEALRSADLQLEIVINNAGIAHVGLLSDMTPLQWRQLIQVNLDACFYTARLAIPMMLAHHSGRIINVSSVWGNVGASMEVAYSASKGGVNAFTKALAKELAPSNIQVNAVACGLIDTEMNSQLSAEDKEALCQEIPADRMGTPEEVAELIYQVAHAPAYMTGQIITIDGGWY